MDFVKIGDLVANRFRITRSIGAGSFACVFGAYDLHSGQTVALKMLRPERFADSDTLHRFESRELRLLERIDEIGRSPFVVRLLEKRLLNHEGLPFLVLEYIEGPELKEWLAENGPLELKEIARICADLARGLAVIHAAGGVHRDLKPSNIRMRQGKTPVLVDLGIARALWETQKLTQGVAPLTPRYAAPEQRAGLSATSAADVYALGVCLQEMLAAQSNVPAPLRKLVGACLASDPRARPPIQEIVRVLENFAHVRSSRPSLWPLVFLSGCSVFPGATIRDAASPQVVTCVPLAGVVRQKVHHEATSTDTTFEWSPFGANSGSRTVRVALPNFDPTPQVIVDDGAEGRYEILGWFGETCRHFAVQACEDRAFVRELENCSLPRPMSFTKSSIIRGDINGDGTDDIVTYGQAPTAPGKPISIMGNVLLRRPDGTSQMMTDIFDLSPIDTYHIDVSRRMGDIDRDGCADLVVATYPTGGACSSLIYTFWGDCQGKFSLAEDVAFVPLPVNQPDIGDVDEDGFLDLVTGPDDDVDPGQTFLLRGNGHGFGIAEEFVDIFPEMENGRDQPGYGGVLLEDVNGDGHLDVIAHALSTPPGTGNNETIEAIHWGRGDGTFEHARTFSPHELKQFGTASFLPIRGR